MAKFRGRRAAHKAPNASAESVDGEAREQPAATEQVTRRKQSPAGGKPADAGADSAPEQVALDYAKVGEHVGTVLEAAKAAAEKMLIDASRDARQIRADAQLQAKVGLEESQTKVERADAEAARLYADAKQRSDEARDEADAYAASTRQAAEADVAAILQDAEMQALDRVDAAQRRQRTLDRNIAATEQRLRQLVGGVRELASGLEELVPPEISQESAAAESADLWGLATAAPAVESEQAEEGLNGH
jgi:F0F1-type ATP synthase membrane subunit b/b'